MTEPVVAAAPASRGAAAAGQARPGLAGVVRKGWRSSTLMTWGSLGSRWGAAFLVLPLILTHLPAADIALWYLFSTLIALQLLADLGFSPTFVRVIAYAMGGAGLHELGDYRAPRERAAARAPNWATVEQLCVAMRVVYNRLTLIAMAGLATAGTLAVARPIAGSPNREHAWIAWGVVLVGSTVALRGNLFSAYLQGVNHVADLRRWEAITNLGSVAASVVVLLAGGGLLGLVVVNQAWMVVDILRNRWLCRYVEGGRFARFAGGAADPAVLRAVWPSAWRSGLGMLLAQAPVQFTGVFYAQVGAPAGVATYLLALRLLTALRGFSMAPFYSKLPLFSRLRAEGRLAEQIAGAQKGMRLSHWTYALVFVAVGACGTPLLHAIGSHAEFPDPLMWSLLGTAMFAERLGAMHLQLYSTTNHITWHIVNGVTSAVFVVLSAALYLPLGVYAFPVAYLVSYAGYYARESVAQSHRALAVRFWSFEKSVFVAPAAVVLGFVAVSLTAWLAR
ncbi:MAG TPA: hypothetical protein VFJ82_01400 [Longimicrobium sp.]|nr:hypothetical protein [Longimicrobium sp.]